MLRREGDDLLSLEEQGFRGFHGNHSNPRLMCCIEGARSDDRHIKTKIMVGFCDFHHYRVLVSERSSTLHRGVGPLERFDGKDGSRLHNDGLTNIQSAGFLGEFEAVAHIFLFASAELRAGDQPLCREVIIHIDRRRKQLDVRPPHLRRDCAEDRFSVALAQPR